MRLLLGAAIAAGYIVVWAAAAWLVMLVTLYIVRVIPMSGRRRTGR
jgi:hypothetical protein